MPTHILVECPELIVSAKIGVMDSLAVLGADRCTVVFRRTLDIRAKDIAWADILVTVRGCEPSTWNIVEQAKLAGRFVIYYLDDDLLNVPRESTAWEYYHDPLLVECMQKILKASDALWGVNPNIGDKYLPLTQSGRWMQNHLPIRIPESIHQPEDGSVRVLYAGSVDHRILVREILSPVVRKLSGEYGDKVEFVFIGADPGLGDCAQVKFIPFIKPYEAYRAFVEGSGFAIGLAPARKEAFYACKYYNKFVEYASIGVTGLYSHVEPYTQIVTDQVNGILCENTPEAWYAGIQKLIEGPALVRRCRETALEQLRGEFSSARVSQELTEQCPELVSFHAECVDARKIKIKNAFLYFYTARAALLWRERGLKSIPGLVYKTIKVLSVHFFERIRGCVQRIYSGNHRK